MKRSGPIERRTPLKRGGELKRTSGLRHRSKKTAELYRTERVPLTQEMLAENPFCEVCPRIKTVDPTWDSCWRFASGLHEIVKRSAGGSIIDRSNCIRACSPGNSWIEDRPNLARKAGLSRRRNEVE